MNYQNRIVKHAEIRTYIALLMPTHISTIQYKKFVFKFRNTFFVFNFQSIIAKNDK